MSICHSIENPKKTWWENIKLNRRVYFFGFLSMFLTNGTEVLAPKTLQWIIDALLNLDHSVNANLDSLRGIWIASGLFFIVALGGLLGRVLWRLTLARRTHIAGNELKFGIWESIKNSPLDCIQKFTLGDLMNRSIGDVNAARWIYGFTMVGTCDVLFFTSLGAIAMLLIHTKIALACLSTFIIIPPLVVKIARREFIAHDDAQRELTTLSEHVSQAVRGVRAQRAGHSFYIWVESLTQSAERYAKLRKKEQFIAINSYPISSIPTLISYVILFLWGPSLVFANEITVGEFAALASYVYLMQGPLGEIGTLVAEWQRGFSSIKRINEIQALKSIQAKDPVKNIGRYQSDHCEGVDDKSLVIEVSDLSINHAGRNIFSGVNLQMKFGEWVGVEGAVGCGKSTLLQAIAGLVEIENGVVKIHGINGNNCDQNDRGRGKLHHVVYAPERPFVFAGSIRHNLSLNHTYSEKEIWEVLRMVYFDAEVAKFSKGLDSIVGEGGVSLSGGQRQRLALARVILRADHVVLLDDPLSAVDVYTEATIVQNLRERWKSNTVIWTSNKSSTLHCCNRVFTLTKHGLQENSVLKSKLSEGANDVSLPVVSHGFGTEVQFV